MAKKESESLDPFPDIDGLEYGPNIYERILDVMKEVQSVSKDGNMMGQYNFASHDNVVATLRPALIKHGIVVCPTVIESGQDENRAWCKMRVRFLCANHPSDFVDMEVFGYGIDKQDKGPGKAMSYAKKYALLQQFLMETKDDPENDSVNYEPPRRKVTIAEERPPRNDKYADEEAGRQDVRDENVERAKDLFAGKEVSANISMEIPAREMKTNPRSGKTFKPAFPTQNQLDWIRSRFQADLRVPQAGLEAWLCTDMVEEALTDDEFEGLLKVYDQMMDMDLAMSEDEVRAIKKRILEETMPLTKYGPFVNPKGKGVREISKIGQPNAKGNTPMYGFFLSRKIEGGKSDDDLKEFLLTKYGLASTKDITTKILNQVNYWCVKGKVK